MSKCTLKILVKPMSKYGIYYGRFQPFHKGHQHVVDTIIKDGLTPVILIGSPTEYNTKKNPYSFYERKAMIRRVYSGITIMPLFDIPGDNHAWAGNIEFIAEEFCNNNAILYVHNKESERGKYGLPRDTFITDLINLPKRFVDDCKTVSHINATQIRECTSAHSDKVHNLVYRFIQKLRDGTR